MNDVSLTLNCNHLSYAGDVNMYLLIANLNFFSNLPANLNIFNKWCKLNNLSENPLKCKILTYSNKDVVLTHRYFIDGIELKRVISVFY